MDSSARVVGQEGHAHSYDSMHVMVQNMRSVDRFHGENSAASRTSNSAQHYLFRIFSAVSFLLSAIGATPNSVRELALLADWHLRDLCWSFGFQPGITQALYVSLLATSGSACVFLIGMAIFVVFSCAAGISGLVSVAGGLLWGISVGGAGGTALMGVSLVAPTFLLSTLGAVIIGLVGAASAPKRLQRDDQGTSHRLAAAHSTTGTARRERQIQMPQLPSSFAETLQAVGSMANLHQERKRNDHQRHIGQRLASASPNNSSEALDGKSSFMSRNVRGAGTGNTSCSSSTLKGDPHPSQIRSRRTQHDKEMQGGGNGSESIPMSNVDFRVTRAVESSSPPPSESTQGGAFEDHHAGRVESSSLLQSSFPKRGAATHAPVPTRRVAEVPSLRTRRDMSGAPGSSTAGSGWPPDTWGEDGGTCMPPLSARSREALVHGRAVLL
jgi:hypothetical protein